MAKSRQNSGKTKIVFRRVRGRIVPIRVQGGAEVGAGYGIAAGAGAAGAIMLKPKKAIDKFTAGYLSGGIGDYGTLRNRFTEKKAAQSAAKKGLLGYSQAARKAKLGFGIQRNAIDKVLDGIDKAANLTPSRVFALGQNANKWAKRLASPTIVAGSVVGSTIAVAGTRKLLGKNADTATGQVIQTSVGAGAFSASTFGFLRASGRGSGRAAVVAANVAARAVRQKPIWQTAAGMLPRAVRLATKL